MEGNRRQYEVFRAERVESAVDRVLNTFKEALITGELVPGEKIPPELDLSRQLAVSRGSVREAMKILSAFGIVEIRRGDGTYITKSDHKVVFDPLLFSLILSHAKMRELVELRELMEFAIVKLVIHNAGDEDLGVIEERIGEMEALIEDVDNQPKLIAQSDVDFHYALGRATNNHLIEKIYKFVIDFFTPSIRLTHENQEKGQQALTCHRKIYEALRDRDIDRAFAAVEGSIMEWKKRALRETEAEDGRNG
jgi:GntR family transcriptional repressor for pyruvate dehydrogenase complex